MKLQGQMEECPQRYLKFVRKIRTAVAFTRPVFLAWASIYSRKQLLNISNIDFGKNILFRYFVSWFFGLQTAPNHLHKCSRGYSGFQCEASVDCNSDHDCNS